VTEGTNTAGDSPRGAAAEKIEALEARIAKLEKCQELSILNLKKMADSVRPYYGISAVAGVLDEGYARLDRFLPKKEEKSVDELLNGGKNG
jgi:hypothetical protein